MKKLLTLLALMIALAGCTYKKDGMFVKGADGNIYRLKKALPNETYTLEPFDTIEFKKLRP